MLFTVLVILLVVFLVGGAVGHKRFGYLGWSPLGVVLLVLGVLYFTHHLGRLH